MPEPTTGKLAMIARAAEAAKHIRTPTQAREDYIAGRIEVEEYEAVLDRWNWRGGVS